MENISEDRRMNLIPYLYFHRSILGIYREHWQDRALRHKPDHGQYRRTRLCQAILRSMLRLKRVFQKMAVLKNGCYPTGAGRRDGRIGGPKICAETGIPESALPRQW